MKANANTASYLWVANVELYLDSTSANSGDTRSLFMRFDALADLLHDAPFSDKLSNGLELLIVLLLSERERFLAQILPHYLVIGKRERKEYSGD